MTDRRGQSAAVVFHTSLIGGPVRSLGDEIRWLSDRGSVQVVVPAGEALDPVYSQLGGELVALPYSAFSSPAKAAPDRGILRRFTTETRMFRAWLRSSRPDFVLAVTTVLPALVLAARLEGVPVVLYAAEIPPREQRLGESRARAWLRRLVNEALIRMESKSARAVLVCSPGVAPMVADPGGAIIHYPPIDPDECRGDGDAFREEIGISGGSPLIVCIGSISRGRGQDVLISTLPYLLGKHPGLKLLINGAPFPREQDVEYSAELDRQIAELGLENSVIRRERTDPLGPLLSAADVVVNPATTYNEGFGRVAFEAGLAGTPMVASARGVLPDLHDDGETILLVPPSDQEALARAIERLLSEPDLSERIAGGAARLAAKLASPEASLEVFKEAVSAVVSSPASRT